MTQQWHEFDSMLNTVGHLKLILLDLYYFDLGIFKLFILVLTEEQWDGRRKQVISFAVEALAPALLIPGSLLIYLLINYFVYADPFQFLVYQKMWWHNSFYIFARTLRFYPPPVQLL